MLNAIGRFIYDVLKNTAHWVRSVFIAFFSILLILFVFFLFAGLVSSNKTSQDTSNFVTEKIIQDQGSSQKIIIVPLSGIILSQTQNNVFMSSDGVITPDQFREVLSKAASDYQVKAVVFDINSPGGSPVASDRIYEQIQNFKNETGKPVVFLMGEIAASGAYYIASAADFIVANPSTLTGSIGVILESYNLEELYKKIGVSKNTFKQGDYKDILSDSRPITEEERKIINNLNENTYNLFISRVASGRKKSEDQIRTIANGQIYSGTQAKELGLVDSLGNFDEAVYQAKSLANIQDYQVIEYSTGSVWKEIFGSIQAPSLSNLIQAVSFAPKSFWVQK